MDLAKRLGTILKHALDSPSASNAFSFLTTLFCLHMSFDEMLVKVRGARGGSEFSRSFISSAKIARNVHGDTLLHIAAAEGSENAVTILLEIGCDVNAQDNFGSTAIQSAAWREYRCIVEKLLLAGAKTTIADSTGFTAIENLRLLGKNEMADFLSLWHSNGHHSG